MRRGYCTITVNSEIFARILFSLIELNDIFATLKSRLWRDLPISVNDRVIPPNRESFIFTNFAYAKFRENKTLGEIFKYSKILQTRDSDRA